MALGCSLLLGDLGLLEESSPDTFRAARPNIVFRSERDKLISNLRNIPSLRSLDEDKNYPYFHSRSEGFIAPAGSSFKGTGAMMRKRASVPWSSERLCTSEGQLPHVKESGITQQPSGTKRPLPPTEKPALNTRRSSFLRPNRTLQSQAAWAAVYESSHAVQPDYDHHLSDQRPAKKKGNDNASTNHGNDDNRRQAQSTRLSLRGGLGQSARGWESFRHTLLQDLIEEDDDNDVENPEAVNGDADSTSNNEINIPEMQAPYTARIEKNTTKMSTPTLTTTPSLGTSVESSLHDQIASTAGGQNNENDTRLPTTAEVGEEDRAIEEA